MKTFARIILVSSLALAAGCVSRIDIEHWTLEPCDAATTAEIARLVEEGASRDGRVWNDNVRHEERERRRYKLRDGTTIASESSPIRFGTNTVCVAVARHVVCYRLLRREMAGLGNSNANKRSERK